VCVKAREAVEQEVRGRVDQMQRDARAEIDRARLREQELRDRVASLQVLPAAAAAAAAAVHLLRHEAHRRSWRRRSRTRDRAFRRVSGSHFFGG
jgi:hypothetical protein